MKQFIAMSEERRRLVCTKTNAKLNLPEIACVAGMRDYKCPLRILTSWRHPFRPSNFWLLFQDYNIHSGHQ